MAITHVEWLEEVEGARDIHLLPGQSSPRLDHLLYVGVTGGKRIRSDTPPTGTNWIVAFDATFGPGNYGVVMNGKTGEITVAANLPALRLRSFIVTATVTENQVQVETWIRVHIHDKMTDKWLTPSRLTVRQGAKNMRFSVLARFDDGVIGDITNWAPLRRPEHGEVTYVRPAGSAQPVHSYTPAQTPGAKMYVDPVTGEITCADASGTVNVVVHDNAGFVAVAVANGEKPWDTPVEVKPVAGLGFPAMDRKDVHNVLILPDGFSELFGIPSEQPVFEAYVRNLVSQLTTSSLTRPFDLFGDKLNFFTAWVPSPDQGISPLAEHFSVDPPDPTDGHLIGHRLENPTAPTGVPARYTLEELLFAVGPPTPVHDPPFAPLGDDATGRPHTWQQLFGPLQTAARAANAYDEWISRDTRVLFSERDTAFHVAQDHRPRVDRTHSYTEMMFHPLRLIAADFNKFLGALTDDKGNKLIHNPWVEGGKDQTLVVIVCRSGRFGGTNNFRDNLQARYLCVPVHSESTHDYLPGTVGFKLVPTTIPGPSPADLDPGTFGLVAHELAHTFDVDDEYGGRDGELSPAAINDVKLSPNVQERAALTVTNPADPRDKKLFANGIKWRWPRLRQAGMLAAPAGGGSPVRPGTGPGEFLLTLVPGHAAAFAAGDVDFVKLRTRDLRHNPRYSGRMRVTDVRGNQLTVKLAAGAAAPAGFVAGDLVVAPVRGPDPDYQNDKLGPDLELVHQFVIKRINDTHNPLNAKWDDKINRPCPSPPTNPRGPVPATNFVARPTRPRLSWLTVGLFEGGHTVDCDAFHATGWCTMNISSFSFHGGVSLVTPFCPVCRYAMVDLVEPSGHGRIDANYDPDYLRPPP